MYPTDVETRRQLALERAMTLTRRKRGPPTERARDAQRFGFWLVEIGLRIACERPVPSRA